MKPKFIGIGGGTGAGKSTVCMALQDKYPDTIGVIQLDDYFKPEEDVPRLEGMEKWDHPDSLFLDKLYADLCALSDGRSVTVNTKNTRLNPDYASTEKRIPVVFDPKQLMLVEGYLVFHDERIRKLFTTTIWLEAPHAIRYARRVHFKDAEYEKRVLIPMQREFAEPTKRFAAHVIDTSGTSTADIVANVEQIILSL